MGPPASASASIAASVSAAPSATPPDPYAGKLRIGKGTKVLVFGDSMVNAGLRQRLKPLIEAQGAIFLMDAWGASTSMAWSVTDRLPKLLDKTQPDVVLIILGSNEIFAANATEVGKGVARLVGRLRGLPCAWIGPPVWQHGKVADEAIAKEIENVPPCLYFDSSKLDLQRQPDHIHPTFVGGAKWADALWDGVVSADVVLPPAF